MRLISRKDSRHTTEGTTPPTPSAADSCVGRKKLHAAMRPEGNDGKRSPVFSFPKSFAARVASSSKTSWRSSDGGSDVITTGTCQSSGDENDLPLTTRDSRDAAVDGPSSSRGAIHLSISSGSDSVQVDIVGPQSGDGHCGPQADEDEQDEDDEVCLYTVGNVDYFVRDDDSQQNQRNDGRYISNAAGETRKSSRMGSSFFKRSPKKGNDKPSSGEDGDDEAKKDEPNDESEGNGAGDGDDGEGGDKRDFKPTREVNFDDLRVQFAEQCTLALHAGAEDAAPAEMPTWTPVDGTKFMVRKGPNYVSTKEKGRSLPSLYEVFAVRYYRSDKRTIGGATHIMPLPPLPIDLHKDADEEHEADGKPEKHHPELEGTKVPDVLVVHFMLPYDTPNMFKAKTDGKGGECGEIEKRARDFTISNENSSILYQFTIFARRVAFLTRSLAESRPRRPQLCLPSGVARASLIFK